MSSLPNERLRDDTLVGHGCGTSLVDERLRGTLLTKVTLVRTLLWDEHLRTRHSSKSQAETLLRSTLFT